MPRAVVYPIACPLFVHLVEEDFQHHHATRLIAQDYLRALSNTPVDTIILGCTHYPLLRHIIQEILGSHITVVDAAVACTKELKTVLVKHSLLCSQPQEPRAKYFVSDDPEGFRRIGSKIIAEVITDVHLF